MDTNYILMILPHGDRADALQKQLKSNGFNTSVAASMMSAQFLMRQSPPSLILLDRRLLSETPFRPMDIPATIPVIVVQPFGQPCEAEECLEGLDAGFDLVFCSSSYRELIAHIRAMLRRHEVSPEPSPQLRVEGLSIDIARHEVKVRDAFVDLTPKEFKILYQFLRSPGRVLSRQELLNRVWGEDYALEEHALDVHIHSLRQKIEPNSAKPTFIITIRGVGYKLQRA